MMKNFDGELGMFREESATVDFARLSFVRWLVEHGKLERPPAGPPSGPFAEALREAFPLAGAA
jgi:hypothetical protein